MVVGKWPDIELFGIYCKSVKKGLRDMAVKVGINGFGRIGRNIVRTALGNTDIEFVGINDITDPHTLAHLLKYDSVLGIFGADVEYADNSISINGHKIRIFAERDPSKIDWASVGAEIVIESTGLFTDADKAKAHLRDGVKKVIISCTSQKRRHHHRAWGKRAFVRS